MAYSWNLSFRGVIDHPEYEVHRQAELLISVIRIQPGVD